MSAEPSSWFVKDEGDIAGPLTEAEMRRLVMQPSKRTLYVRQGTSDWHPAEVIRNKIAALTNNGIYVLVNAIEEGPFTLTKAYEILQTPKYDDSDVRTGVNGQWVPARLWLARIDELKRERELQSEGGPLSGAMADVANEAGKFLEQLDKPGLHRLASATAPASTASASRPFKPKQTIPKQAKLAIGICVLVAIVGLLGWMALRAFQRRHLSTQYRIDASYDSIPWSPKSSVASSIPIVPGQLFRPRFITTFGTAVGGTAFAAKVPSRDGTFIVSSLHLLGSTNGLSADVSAASITQQWTGLELRDSLTAEPSKEVAIQPITFSKSAPFPQTSTHGDVVVCSLVNADQFPTNAFPLSSNNSQVGDRVSMVAQVQGLDTLVHSAIISSIEDGWLVYAFDQPSLRLQATNGAPILDLTGNVVAINAGGSEEQGKTFGIGSPVAKFHEFLLSEL